MGGRNRGEDLEIWAGVHQKRFEWRSTPVTCCLGSNQRGAGRIVMQSDDLHRVLGAWLQTVDGGGLGVPPGGREQLPFTLLGTGVQDPVGRDDSLGTVPADPQGGGLDVREAEVFGVVHIWMEVVGLGVSGGLVWKSFSRKKSRVLLVKALTTTGELSPS